MSVEYLERCCVVLCCVVFYVRISSCFACRYRDLNRAAFMDQARKLIPSVTDDMVEESFAGVMSQIIEMDGKPAKDFIYERNMLEGTTLHVRSAPTPACTASLSLAEEIVDQASLDFGWGEGEVKVSPTSPFWKRS